MTFYECFNFIDKSSPLISMKASLNIENIGIRKTSISKMPVLVKGTDIATPRVYQGQVVQKNQGRTPLDQVIKEEEGKN